MDRLLRVLEGVEEPLRLLGAVLFAILFVRASREAERSPVRSARWLLARIALAGALLLSVVAGLNYLVNPFGIYSPHLFEPLLLHSRAEKMRLYRIAQPPPEIVVLGSSSSFSMPPAYIRERSGRPAFNASLHGGVPGDYLAFLRYMASLDKVPKLLIVPLSVELLRPNLSASFEPHNPLERYREGEPRDLLEGPRWLLTLEQTRASLRVLAAEQKGRPPSQYRFDADGGGRFTTSSVRLEQVVDAYLAAEWGPDLFRFPALDEAQIFHFRQFLELARRLTVKVIVYIPPLHPRAVALYERETNLPALRTELLEHLRIWQAEGLVANVHDFTRLASFGGEASEFHDLAHPTAEASRRMLDIILRPTASDW